MKKLDRISKARFPADSLNFSGRGCFLCYKESSGSSRRSRRAYALPLSGHIVRSLLAHPRWIEGKARQRYWDSICVSVRTNAISQLQSEEKQRASAKGECGTDDVKWIGQTDRRDRHNSPSKQYLGGARHPGDTCRFPPGNIGLSSRARFRVRVRSIRKILSATVVRLLCIKFARRRWFSRGNGVFARAFQVTCASAEVMAATKVKNGCLSIYVFLFNWSSCSSDTFRIFEVLVVLETNLYDTIKCSHINVGQRV